MKARFNRYIGIDYSGAETADAYCKGRGLRRTEADSAAAEPTPILDSPWSRGRLDEEHHRRHRPRLLVSAGILRKVSEPRHRGLKNILNRLSKHLHPPFYRSASHRVPERRGTAKPRDSSFPEIPLHTGYMHVQFGRQKEILVQGRSSWREFVRSSFARLWPLCSLLLSPSGNRPRPPSESLARLMRPSW